MTNHPATLTAAVLAELANRYTALPDDYRTAVRGADEATLRRVHDLALADAPGREIAQELGMGWWYDAD
ncbi:MAG: hypothetical protein Q8R92_06310 [Deltaproteobacteria bacterium]|nr:hypothetical protein [Deltaproteobacteria bacterium]